MGTVLSEVAADVRLAMPGTRNTSLFNAALRLGRLVAAGLLDEVGVIAHLRAAGYSHVGTAGFTAAEADRAIANGMRYGLDTARQHNKY